MRRWGIFMLALTACTRPPSAPPQGPTVMVVPPGTTKPPPAEPPAPPEEEEEWVAPCVSGTPEHQAAETKLADLAHAIDQLPLTSDPSALATQLGDLARAKCFVGIGDELELGTFDSALSLKTYWTAGGHAQFDARLEWDKPEGRRYWIAPSIRKTLTKESAPAHPLAPLLCSATQPSCGSETAGWALRAERAFELRAAATRAHFLDVSPPGDPPKTHEDCKKDAAAAAPERAFVTFSSCMQKIPNGTDALPLGTFRAPTNGWLLLRGRRGHHGWCDELRAYDLATGAAYITSMCGGMFARQPGAPPMKTEKGRLPIDALREAAWMMFLAETAQSSIVASGTGLHMPETIPVRVPVNRGFSIHGLSISMSSGRTTLHYQWVRSGKSAAAGTVSWPDASGAANEHATDLLAIAEAAFVKGCPPATLPALPWRARKDKATLVAGPDAYLPDYDGPEYDQLERELAHAGAAPCTP